MFASRVFGSTAARVWNSLPLTVLTSSFLNTFRRQLSTENFSVLQQHRHHSDYAAYLLTYLSHHCRRLSTIKQTTALQIFHISHQLATYARGTLPNTHQNSLYPSELCCCSRRLRFLSRSSLGIHHCRLFRQSICGFLLHLYKQKNNNVERTITVQ